VKHAGDVAHGAREGLTIAELRGHGIRAELD